MKHIVTAWKFLTDVWSWLKRNPWVVAAYCGALIWIVEVVK